MGNNQAFSEFEEIVIILYKHGVLTQPILDDIGNIWRNTDIDSGGMVGYEIDGKDVCEICVEIINPDFEPTEERFEDPDHETTTWNHWDEFFENIVERWGWR